MASKVLEGILFIVGLTTIMLAAATAFIALRYRREIYRAEKQRAKEILLRTRIAKESEPNLREDEHALAGHH